MKSLSRFALHLWAKPSIIYYFQQQLNICQELLIFKTVQPWLWWQKHQETRWVTCILFRTAESLVISASTGILVLFFFFWHDTLLVSVFSDHSHPWPIQPFRSISLLSVLSSKAALSKQSLVSLQQLIHLTLKGTSQWWTHMIGLSPKEDVASLYKLCPV